VNKRRTFPAFLPGTPIRKVSLKGRGEAGDSRLGFLHYKKTEKGRKGTHWFTVTPAPHVRREGQKGGTGSLETLKKRERTKGIASNGVGWELWRGRESLHGTKATKNKGGRAGNGFALLIVG